LYIFLNNFIIYFKLKYINKYILFFITEIKFNEIINYMKIIFFR